MNNIRSTALVYSEESAKPNFVQTSMIAEYSKKAFLECYEIISYIVLYFASLGSMRDF